MRKNSKQVRVSASSLAKIEETSKLSRVPIEQVTDDAIDCGLLSEQFEAIYGPMINFRRGRTLVEVFSDENKKQVDTDTGDSGTGTPGISTGAEPLVNPVMEPAFNGDAGQQTATDSGLGDASFLQRFSGSRGEDIILDDDAPIRAAK